MDSRPALQPARAMRPSLRFCPACRTPLQPGQQCRPQATARELEQLEQRVLDAEQELRALRVTLQLITACTCPVGFGSAPDPRCPKHGDASRAS